MADLDSAASSMSGWGDGDSDPGNNMPDPQEISNGGNDNPMAISGAMSMNLGAGSINISSTNAMESSLLAKAGGGGAGAGGGGGLAIPEGGLQLGMGLFTPGDGVQGGGLLGLDDPDRPMLPMHSQEDLPPGTQVWLCDAEDFSTLMKGEFTADIVPLTHGNAIGVVKRHSDNNTFVQFDENPEWKQGFSLPRQALSKNPIAAKPVTFKIKKKMPGEDFGGIGDLGPKAGRQNPNKQTAEAAAQQAFTPFDNFVVAATGGVPMINIQAVAAPSEASPRRETLLLYKDKNYGACEEKLSLSVQGHAQRRASMSTAASPSGVASPVMSVGGTSAGSPVGYVMSGSTRIDDVIDEFGMTEKEALVWRAGCRLKRNQLDEALVDALQCIEIDPDWTPGFVRSAEVYIAQGKHQTAKNLLEQAAFLAQGNAGHLVTLMEVNEALSNTDTLLSRKGLNLTVDGEMVKKLVTKRRFAAGETILTEFPSAWVPTLLNEVDMCPNCSNQVALGTGIPPPNPKVDSSRFYSQQCFNNVMQRYGKYESMEAAKQCFSTNYVIRDRAGSVANTNNLEIGALSARAFNQLVVHARTRIPEGHAPPNPFSVIHELEILGLMPTPNTPVLDSKLKSDVGTLWSLLTSHLGPMEKDAFPVSVMNNIFMAASNYAVRKESRGADGKLKSQLLLFPTISSVAKDSTLVEICPRVGGNGQLTGEWELRALKDIEPQTTL